MLTAPVYEDAVASEQRDFPNYVDNYLLTLPDDVPCFNPFATYEKAMTLDAAQGRKNFVDARSVIARNLQQVAGNPRVLLKWEWLARVYNDLIHHLGETALPGIARILS